MEAVIRHKWDLSITDAVSLQKELATKVQIIKPTSKIRYIGGIDCAPSHDKLRYFAAAVVWDLEHHELMEYHLAEAPITFPYIPGLLSFREIPAILEVVKNIKHIPDLLIVDGHGIAHPRRFGIACHLGVLLDMPTFGCGKSLLFGKYNEPSIERGSISPLMVKNTNTIIGNVIRTRTKVKPVIVSVGNKIDLETATELTLSCSGKFRLPEPTRLADNLVAQKETKNIYLVN